MDAPLDSRKTIGKIDPGSHREFMRFQGETPASFPPAMIVSPRPSGFPMKCASSTTCLLLLISIWSLVVPIHASVSVSPKDVVEGSYTFTANGTDLENVNGALLEQENVKFKMADDGGRKLYYLFADGSSNQQHAQFVLKWDFSESGHLATQVSIPTNRLYFQSEPGCGVTAAKACISYSTDGINWTEADVWETSATISDVSAAVSQNNKLELVLDQPASSFYYRVTFDVEGSPFYQETFQWERMSGTIQYLDPEYFRVIFTLK